MHGTTITCLTIKTVLKMGCFNFDDRICGVTANQFSRMYSMLYSDESAHYVPDTRLKWDMMGAAEQCEDKSVRTCDCYMKIFALVKPCQYYILEQTMHV